MKVWDMYRGQQCVLCRRTCYFMNANDLPPNFLTSNGRYGDEYENINKKIVKGIYANIYIDK